MSLFGDYSLTLLAFVAIIPPSYQVIIPLWLTGGQAFEELVPAEEIDELEGWSAGSVEEAMQVNKNYN